MLEGVLDLDALERSVNEIVRRHEVLRTRIEVELGEPAQVIDAWEPRRLDVVDLRSLSREEREAEVGRRAREEAETGFDLSRGPLLRLKALKLEEEKHVLLYTMHHIVSDEWSTGILIKEVGTFYQSYLEGEESPLPELEVQYADFAVWQRSYLAGEVLEKEVGYWREQLRGAAALELPADRARPAAPSYRGGLERFELGHSLSEGLRKLSQRGGLTIFMTLMAAFKALLMRYGGQEDISVGTAIANRTRKEVEGLIGFFVNTLVMRTDLSGNPSFRELMRREREVALGAYAHQELPFEKLVEELNPDRDLSRNPLFQAMMILEHAGRETLELPGVKLSGLSEGIEIGGEGQGAKFDLTLSMADLGQELIGVVEYSRDLFDAGTIGRLVNHYVNVLQGVVKDGERLIRSLDLLGEGERKQIVEEWNATEADHPKEKFIHELFEEQAERSPHAVALIYEEQNLTYGELNVRANRLAHHLRKFGVGPEARVAMRLERSLEMVVAMLATLKAGGAYVPLDPAYPSGRLAYMLEDSEPAVLLTQGAVRSAPAPRLPAIPMLDLESDQTQWDAQSEQNPEHGAAGSDARSLAYIIYTSGSTGAPKGVMVGHANVVRLMESTGRWFGFGPADVWTLFHSYAFDFSVWEMWGALAYGGRLVIVPQATTRSPEEFHGLLRRAGVTVLNQTPSAFRQLISVGSGKAERHELRHVIFGGEALDVGMLKPWYGRNEGQPTRLVNMYGITETTVHVTCRLLEESDTRRSGASPIGRRIPDMKTYILGAYGELAPVGVKGELHVGGAGVARGYLNRPELTAERFQPDANGQEAGARIYKTGDLGRWLSEGEIEFLGRNDSQVKIRGYRIELGEIEAGLMSHPEVEDAVVIAAEGGVGSRRLIAYYTGREMGAEALRAHLAEALPDYMAPAAYVRLERMPLTPNGKLDRRALPAPEGGAYLRRGYEEPLGERERKLARIWAEALKLDRVGRNDNFFELGGHSLLVITVIERMRREGMEADARTLFTAPTLQALAEAVKGRRENEVEAPPNLIPAGCGRITPEMLPLIALRQEEIDAVADMTPGGAANIQDIYPLAPLQEGILFHHLMSSEGDAYLVSSLLAFDTRERLGRFARALQAVIDRHDILRTAVVWEGLPEPVQVVWREAPMIMEEVQLDQQEGEIARQLLARFNPRSYRLDVRQAPLMRCFAAYDAVGERWLLQCLNHHLTIDHTTLEIMTREAHAHLIGEVGQLPEPLPYRNLVAQARNGIGREEHEAFFREMLGDVDEPTAPFGLLDAQGDGSGIDEAGIELDAGLSNRLRERARMMGVSAASLCHLAWALVLARVSDTMSRRGDVVFGTVLLGRMQGGEGAGRTLGLFINTLPIRIQVDEEGIERIARQVHRLLAELIGHEHASLALAQRCSRVEASAPLFSSLLNYRHSSRETDTDAEAARSWTGVKILASEERTNYPLMLSINDLGDGFTLVAQAAAPVDPPRVCELMRTALERLVEALEKAPETPARAIDALPEAERRQVVEEWNATKADYPKKRLIHELFEEQAEKNPHAVALVYEERSLSYGELNVSANRLAWRLRELGVGPEARVAICLERGLEMVIAMLATLKAGGAYAPLDPAYPSERLAYMLEDSEPVVLLTHGATRSALAAHTLGLCAVDLDTDASQWAGYSEVDPENAGAGLNAQRLAYILYTSGSTGLPKGVAIEHRSVVNFICWAKSAFNADALERTLFSTSINFDLAVYELFVPLAVGATATIVGNALDLVQSPAEVTLVNTVPSAMKSLVDTKGVPKSVRTVNLAGEPLKRELVESIFAATEAETVCNLYGPSETTTYSTWVAMGRGKGFEPHIGQPIANTQIYILDEWLKPTPVGVTGEIYIGGAGDARGYLNRPEMTAERFLPDLFSREPGGRNYKTGDLGKWSPEGTIEFLGRNDYQVKIRGFRIELGEVEARLSNHPGVIETVVIAREENKAGKRLVAYYSGEEVSSEALRAHLTSCLPDYMVPAAYVRLESLPLTPNGKLDRRALPAPDMRRTEERDDYLAPLTPVEEIVVRIFEDILNQDRIGRRDNFFEQGGHSLLATQVISRVRKMLEVEIGVRSVFEKPTAEGLASKIVELMRAGEKAPIPPLVRASRKERTPLSFAQQRLWLLDQLIPNDPLYNMPGALRLKGSLNLDALERSVNEIVRRHEVLRTRIEVEAGAPVQVIDQWAPRRLEVVDLTGLPQEEREEEVHRRAGSEAETGFDLSRGPMLRITVLKLEEDDYVLLYTLSHIVSDGWSMGILTKEIGALYQAYSAGESSPLDELPVQYVDYAIWQRDWLKGEALERQLAYWRKQLAGAPPLEMPADRLRSATPSYRGGHQDLIVDNDLAQNLRRLSGRQGGTLFMTLLAAFKALLYRHSRQIDISVGTPIAGRNFREIESLIGFFVNTLVLRTDLSGDPSFSELLDRVKEVALGAYAHQDAPFEMLVAELRPEREMSRSPLFQAMLTLQNVRSEELKLRDLGLSSVEAENKTAKFDLDLTFIETDAGMAGFCTYSVDLYEAQTIERLTKHYVRLLSAIVKDPERKIWQLEMMSEEEKAQICVEWNSTYRKYPVDRLIPELFEEQVIRTPHNLAAVYRDQRLTYSQLNDQVNRLSRRLIANGVERGTYVPILIDRGLELVVAMLAVMKSGAAFVPIDLNWPAARIKEAFKELKCQTVLSNKSVETERLQEELSDYALILVDLEGEEGSSGSTANPGIRINPDDPIYIIYTSGSTGKPKGAINIHRGITNRFLWMNEYLGIRTAQAALQVSRHFFDGVIWELLWPLINGGKTVLAIPELVADADYMVETIEEQSVTITDLAPSVLSALVPQLVANNQSREKMRSLRSLIVGGEELKAETALAFKSAFPEVQVINLYGPTETSIGCISYEVTGTEEGKIPIGKPISNTHALIVDGQGNLVPIGVTGEIFITGMCLGLGYADDEEKTRRAFIERRYEGISYDRFYKTGDLARWRRDGIIEFLGRVDEQIKIRGVRIEPGEIEAALRQLEGVKEVVVAAKEDGNGNKHLVAYYVETGGKKVKASELRECALRHLPEDMTPRYYVALEQLPLTASGKIDRRALPAPQFEQVSDRIGESTPRTAIEEILAGIWAEVLKSDRIGVEDNFFDLGGHSLLATQVISRVRKAFKAEVALRRLFERPTVRGFAESVEELMRAAERGEKGALGAPALEKANRNGRAPLSFAQQRLWFIDQLEPGNTVYNIPGALRLEGALNLGALERVINEIVRRHEILRTRIEVEAGEPVQVINDWEPWRLEVIDLTSLSPVKRKEEAIRREREDATTGFDLSRGPLFRVKVLKLEDDDHVLLYTMHHIVSDEWSSEILTKEVCTLYRTYTATGVGEESPLAELEIQYADFAVWQRAYLAGGLLEDEVEYWRQQLKDAPALELPADRARPAEPSYRGGRERLELGRSLGEGLRRLSRREGVTLFMTLMAAFKALLMRYGGQEDISVGTATANRTRKEVEGLIGFFVNTLVMRTDLSGNPSFRELVRREREVALGAYAHQELPFEKLVEELNPERDLSRNPLFQVMMGLDNAGAERFEIEGLKLRGLENETAGEEKIAEDVTTGTAKFDLELALIETAEGIEGILEYSRDLFEQETIRRMARHYEKVVEEVVRDAEQTIREIVLLSATEREQILLKWNQTDRAYPEDQLIHELFEGQVEKTPDAVAAVFGDQGLSYQELNARANRMTRALIKQGVGPESLVAVLADRGTDFLITMLAVFKAGGAYIPLDPRHPSQRISQTLSLSAAAVVVAASEYEALAAELINGLNTENPPAGLVFEDLLENDFQTENLGRHFPTGQLAYVIFTSGSNRDSEGSDGGAAWHDQSSVRQDLGSGVG